MKNLILLISMSFIFSGSFAQKKELEDPIYHDDLRSTSKLEAESMTNNNFLIENSKLIWQKVFENQMSFESLVTKIKAAGVLENIEVSDSRIIGDLRRLPIDFRSAGYKSSNVSMIILASDLLGYVVIDIKESKYRVTIRNIKYIQKQNDPLGKQDKRTDMEVMAIKNGSFKKSFFSFHQAELIDYSFCNALSFNLVDSNDNW